MLDEGPQLNGIVSEWPTIWTQLREAADGRSERVPIQGNRVS
jgi:hypothetical protein